MRSEFLRLSILFGLVYFTHGISAPDVGIAVQPLNYYLKDTLGFTASELAYFSAFIVLPWAIKPLWGLLSDFVPIFGSRRKVYLVCSSLLSGLAWLALAFNVAPSYSRVLFFILLGSVGFSIADVVTDALMVEKGKHTGMTGRFQAIQWALLNIAAVITGIGGGWMAEHFPQSRAFLLASTFPFLTAAVALSFVKEEKIEGEREHAKKTWASLGAALRSRPLWFAALFLFLWTFSPSFGAPLFYKMRDDLHFSKIFIGALGSIGSAMSVIGALAFWWIARKWPLKRMLAVLIGLGTVFTLAYLWLVGPKTALTLSIIGGFLGMISMLAVLDFAARISPEFSEGTVFAGLMSVYNLGSVGSSFVGGWLFPIIGLSWLIVISAAATAILWFFLPFLKTEVQAA